MELKVPKVGLPWRRNKSTLERAGDELQRLRADLGRRADQINLPKIELHAPSTEGITGAVDDTRQAISQGVEQVADQLAVGTAAIAREAGKLGREAGRIGQRASRFSWRRGAGSAEAAASVAAARRRSRVVPGLALLTGVGAGLAAMFFLDPEQGRRRRALVRDQLTKWTRKTRETLDGRLKDVRNRTVGLTHELRSLSSRASGDGQSPVANEIAVAETTPHAAPQLSETDLAAGRTEEAGAGGTGPEPASGLGGAYGETGTTARAVPVETGETWTDEAGLRETADTEHDVTQRG